MATETLDCMGLKCPQPVLKIAAKAPSMKQGDVLEVFGDCPSFENDAKRWCEKMQKVLISCVTEGAKSTAQIQF